MDQSQLSWITNFIWGIADDVLRDLYVRGKYRDVILPMIVVRRLDTLLEPTKQAVLELKALLDREGIVNQDQALRQTAGIPLVRVPVKHTYSLQEVQALLQPYIQLDASQPLPPDDKPQQSWTIPRCTKCGAEIPFTSFQVLCGHAIG